MRAVELVKKVSSSARAEYVAAFDNGDTLLVKYGLTTPLRLSHFLAQVMAETGGLVVTWENMNYSASRMLEIFGAGHHSSPVSVSEANALAHHPEQMAERVYGMNSTIGKSLGNVKPGDGWRYRGGGIMQTTGRYNYRLMGQLCGVDFENHPELVLSAEHALKPALAEWDKGNCNKYADANDILSISRIINLGNASTSKIPNGMNNRHLWFNRVFPVLNGAGVTFLPTTTKPVVEPPKTVTKPVVQAPAPAKEATSIWAIIASIFAAVFKRG